MKKIKLLSTLAFASLGLMTIASCRSIKNNDEMQQYLLWKTMKH